MLRQSRYFVACCGAVFAVVSFGIGLEVSSTTAATSAQGPVAINRALKADRLLLLPATTHNAVTDPVAIKAPPAPAPRPVLLEGCEPIMSTIGQPPLSRVAGRCLS